MSGDSSSAILAEPGRVCRACPVHEECLSLVVRLSDDADRAGILGGLDVRERRRLRRALA